MIDFEAFVKGCTRIALAVRQEPDRGTLEVYFEAFSTETDEAEWERFTRAVVKAGRFAWFPKLAELHDALRAFRGAPPLEAEATRAYEAVLAAGTYSPEGGTTWDDRTIRARLGDAAAEAFLCAGGNGAFSTTWDEEKRRERFVRAYASAVREDPGTALLPPGEQRKALPAPPASPDREEAARLLQEIETRGGNTCR